MKFNKSNDSHSLISLLYDIMIALVIVLIVTNFFVQNMRVIGGSMAPFLNKNDMVIINKSAYLFNGPDKGDIIVFNKPQGKEKYVKRVIALPGDRIDYRNKMIYINDQPITALSVAIRDRGDIEYPAIIPEDCYFVIGDNYNNSVDSRYSMIGYVHKKQIVGEIVLRIWPFWVNPLLQ
ncbi:MAG: signal peptidase I [Cellulosilyticaceae bacterium]